jgi:hypothetical protein
MAEDLRVVARFANGNVLKGTLVDFSTKVPAFQLHPQSGGAPLEVRFADLKAVFFVKDLQGRSQRRNLQGFLRAPGMTPQGIKIAVRFPDGEVLCGYSAMFVAGCEGFFMFPADATSNNFRVYVITASTTEIGVGGAAEALARKFARRAQATRA